MKTANRTGLAIMLGILIGTSSLADAAEPATLWNFLGISQGMQKIRDATVNRRGNRPGRERKPPLKRIADPANLESPNKAIKTAAKIKADQDLAKQKIKAIKYLASVRCGCYPGVKEALLAALDDCSEEVRFEAAIAFCTSSGDPGDDCDKGSCCDAQVMAKLHEMAFGQDEKCCYKEPSARVRAAAKNALDACKQMIPPAPARPPAGREYAPEMPPGETAPEEATPGVTPPPGGGKTTGIAHPVSLTGLTQAGEAQITDDPVVACSGKCGGCPQCGSGTWPGTGVPSDLGEAGPGEIAAPSPDYLAGAYGAASGPQSIAPNMIGDSLGIGPQFGMSAVGSSGVEWNTDVSIAGGARNFKIAENSSPIPTDRVFFNFNHFQRALIAGDGYPRSLDKFTFGIEKTFRDRLWSAELRVPFAAGLNANQTDGTVTPLTATEFGNIALALKRVIRQNRRMTFSGGLGLVFATGRDAQAIDDINGTVYARIKNNALHLQPFLGLLWTPNNRLFFEGFVELDFDCNGNPVYTTEYQQGYPLERRGTLFSQNLLMLDMTVGYWMYRNESAYLIRGIAPMFELHYTTTMQDATDVYGVTNIANRMDVLNATGGLHFQLGPLSTLRIAGVVPLRLGDDALFPAEVSVQFNRRY